MDNLSSYSHGSAVADFVSRNGFGDDYLPMFYRDEGGMMIVNESLGNDGQGGGGVTLGDLIDSLLASPEESSLSPWMQNYLDGNDFTDCCPGENDLLKGVVNGALGTLEDSFGLVGLGIKMIGGKEDLIPRLSTKDKTAELTGILLFAAMEPTPGGEISAGGKIFKNTVKNSSQILGWGKNYKGNLIKHADVLGFGGHSPQELQKMLPQLRSAANQLYNNINPALTRVGRWGGQTDNVIMHITNNGKMLITRQNGEFITVINKTSNNWYQLAKPLR